MQPLVVVNVEWLLVPMPGIRGLLKVGETAIVVCNNQGLPMVICMFAKRQRLNTYRVAGWKQQSWRGMPIFLDLKVRVTLDTEVSNFIGSVPEPDADLAIFMASTLQI